MTLVPLKTKLSSVFAIYMFIHKKFHKEEMMTKNLYHTRPYLVIGTVKISGGIID